MLKTDTGKKNIYKTKITSLSLQCHITKSNLAISKIEILQVKYIKNNRVNFRFLHVSIEDCEKIAAPMVRMRSYVFCFDQDDIDLPSLYLS